MLSVLVLSVSAKAWTIHSIIQCFGKNFVYFMVNYCGYDTLSESDTELNIRRKSAYVQGQISD